MHGWIILDKPLGLGSTQGVSAVKRALRDGGYGKFKVGHGGTLDPLATGVLPIAVGEATKLAGRMLDSDKVYDFTVRFGVQTDTLDLEGAAVASSDVRPTLAQVGTVLLRFTGPIEQVPPAYSALKVDGRRAYDRARAGEDVVLASRSVVIHALTIARHAIPLGSHPSEGEDLHGEGASIPLRDPTLRWGDDREARGMESITFTAHVSKGTYIRSLARDIAIALGTVGHVAMLRRTRAGPFDLSRAISLDKLAEFAKARALEDVTLPLRAALDDIPALPLTPEQAGALCQGRILVGIAADDGRYLAMLAETPVALVEVETGAVRVVRGFNLN